MPSPETASSPETAFSPEKALLDALTRAGLGSGQRVLLACSGGRDSQVLMHVAAVLRPAVRPVVAHVHHGLQPHADDWLQFCADEARVLGLRFLARRLDPATRPPLQRPGSLSGLEAWAREGRYRALADMAAAVGARVVITAHHANDQLETVEMRRRRGSGVLGLAGMREQAPLPHAPAGYRLLRPFLSLSRAQLAHWAETHGLQWVEDPSNQDLRFTRNRIRDALDRQLQDEPQALPGGLAAVGLFQQAADRLLAQAAADVAAATVHVTPRAGRRTGLPAGVPQGLLVAAAPVQATPPDSSLDLTMLLDAPLTVDLASAEAEAGAEAGAEAEAGAGAESGTSTGAGDALPLARPSLVDGSVPGEGLPPAMVLMPPPAAPLLLSRAALMRLDSARRAEALRYWLAALGCRMPSRHKLAEIERQLLLAASSQAIVHHDGIGLLRYRDHIGRLPEVAPIMPTRFQWQGERFIDLPSGRLYIDPVPPGGEERWREVPEALEAAGQEAAMQESAMQESAVQGSAVQGSARQGRAGRAGILVSDGGRVGVLGSWLRRTPLLIDQGRGGDRLRVHPQGPSRSWKHLMQARGIPTCLRPCLPVLRLQEVPRVEGQQGRLLFAAPFGLLAPLAQRMSATAPFPAGNTLSHDRSAGVSSGHCGDVHPHDRYRDVHSPERYGGGQPPGLSGGAQPPECFGDTQPPDHSGDARPPDRPGHARPPDRAGDSIHPPGESEPSPAMHPDAESVGNAGEDAVFTLSWQADDALLPWL